jgi:elongation factor 1 alpha-like protein
VGYLVNTYVSKVKKENKKSVAKKAGGFYVSHGDVERGLKRGAEGWMAEPALCPEPFSFADFFKDTPWLNTPLDRHTVFIEPLYPRGGLLGGSSDGAPKMSKLQALAAARKKKAQEQKSVSSGVEKPMSELSINGDSKEDKSAEVAPKQSSRGFPLRKRKDSNPHEKQSKAPSPKKDVRTVDPDTTMDIAPIDQAEPSAFASTMFSSPIPSAPSANLFTLPYTATTTAATDPFAGPSPDDVVIAAQSKGPTLSGNPKK